MFSSIDLLSIIDLCLALHFSIADLQIISQSFDSVLSILLPCRLLSSQPLAVSLRGFSLPRLTFETLLPDLLFNFSDVLLQFSLLSLSFILSKLYITKEKDSKFFFEQLVHD